MNLSNKELVLAIGNGSLEQGVDTNGRAVAKHICECERTTVVGKKMSFDGFEFVEDLLVERVRSIKLPLRGKTNLITGCAASPTSYPVSVAAKSERTVTKTHTGERTSAAG